MWLEIENVDRASILIQVDDPFAFDPELIDASGRTIAPTSGRIDVLSSSRWITLRPRETSRVLVSFPTEDGGGPAHLDTTLSVWRLSPGTYRFGGSYRSTAVEGPSPVRRWSGRFQLAPIELQIR